MSVLRSQLVWGRVLRMSASLDQSDMQPIAGRGYHDNGEGELGTGQSSNGGLDGKVI